MFLNELYFNSFIFILLIILPLELETLYDMLVLTVTSLPKFLKSNPSSECMATLLLRLSFSVACVVGSDVGSGSDFGSGLGSGSALGSGND